MRPEEMLSRNDPPYGLRFMDLPMISARIKQLAKRSLPLPIARGLGRIFYTFAHGLSRILSVARQRRSPRFSIPPLEIPSILHCCIAYNKNGGFCIPLSSRHRLAAQRILNGSVYEPETIEFMVANCGDGDIVHAGTFFGDFLPSLSRGCASAAKVWAFEPNPENFRCALITCSVSGLENIALYNAGLGSFRGTMQMVVRDREGRSLGGASHLVGACNSGDQSTTEMVDILSLDEIVPPNKHVSILQLDVEGFEQEALTGALGTIRRCRPIIILETMPPEPWMRQHILNLHYKISGRLHRNTILRPQSE